MQRDDSHSVSKRQFCLITINNFSGVNQTVSLVDYTFNKNKLKLYQLSNTDQIWWKTLNEMDDADQHFGTTENNGEFTIVSGTGKGIYAINLDDNDKVHFQTKILKSSSV